MNPNNIPFQQTDWSNLPAEEHKGETGMAYWRTLQFGDLRIRMVEYSKNYKADHWCEKGHIIYCIEGEMTTELSDGKKFVLKKGMSYQVSDELSSHRTFTKEGVKLFIVDGAFLKLK
ncbi:MAG TPA: DHCW motif cupin fold protein [Bacteroidia bacterium]